MRIARSFSCLFTLSALAALLLAPGCGSDGGDPLPLGGGAAGGGGAGTGGGQGGQGNQVNQGCDSCGGDTPICIDGLACADSCPAGRDVCHTSDDPSAPAGCCSASAQCCQAEVYGYAGADVCRPADEPCPVGCPGGQAACPLYEYCREDITTGEYGCVPSCPTPSVCGYNLCCPEGSACVLGQCLLPDLTIDAGVLAGSFSFSQEDATLNPCLQAEQCLSGPGVRTVLRFSTRTLNVGTSDFVIGDPSENPNYHYDTCHMHYHYHQYAAYRLLDGANNVVVTGRKQGFAIIDMGPIDPSDPNTPSDPVYNGGFQGIQRGWYDEYGSYLQCQWIDITGVPPGDYMLQVEVNPERLIAETSYENNVVNVPVTIPASP